MVFLHSYWLIKKSPRGIQGLRCASITFNEEGSGSSRDSTD